MMSNRCEKIKLNLWVQKMKKEIKLNNLREIQGGGFNACLMIPINCEPGYEFRARFP